MCLLYCLLGQLLPECMLWKTSSVRCSVKKLFQSNYVRKAFFFSSYLRVIMIINIVKTWIRIRTTKKKPVYLCFPLALYGEISFKTKQDSYFPKLEYEALQ